MKTDFRPWRENMNNKEIAMNTDNTKAQMRKGILEYCILAIL